MRREATIVCSVCTMLSIEREAIAEEPKRQDYALQIVAMDVGSLLIGAALDSPVMAVGGYMIGSPIVHWAHGDALEGFMSLALHVVAPVVGGFAGRAADHDRGDHAAWGIVGGALLATTVDAAVLARPPQRSVTVIAGRF